LWILGEFGEFTELVLTETTVVLGVETLIALIIWHVILFIDHINVSTNIRSLVWIFSIVIVISLFISFDVSNNINVSPVDVLEHSHLWIHPNSSRSIDTDHFNSISWLDVVHEVLVSAHVDSLWSLTLRNGLGGLLHLDVLLV